MTSKIDWSKFKECLGKLESNNNYQAQNPGSSAIGKYQFLSRFWLKIFTKWLALPDPLKEKDYIRDPELQEKIMDMYLEREIEPQLVKIGRVAQEAGRIFNVYQLAALLHFKGYENAKGWLRTGTDPTYHGNISINNYINHFKDL